MAISHKYGRVTLEHGTIADHEPVVVFRARDRLLPKLLQRYKNMCASAGSSQEHLDEIEDTFVKVLLWQAAWGKQFPGLKPPEEREL